jgi:hypothetical protein
MLVYDFTMLVEVTVSSCSDPFAVSVTGNLGVTCSHKQSRKLKISTLVLALQDAGMPLYSAGEIIEAVTNADISNQSKTVLVEMSDSEFERLICFPEEEAVS